MSNREAREQLQVLYGARCMLTHLKTNLTYHHIKKKCKGGCNDIDNGALLNRIIHSFLHSLERNDPTLYEEINEALQCYKVCVERNETECLEEWKAVQEQARKKIYTFKV